MSLPTQSTRRAGGIALAGAIIGVAVSLLLNVAYVSTPYGVDVPVPPWHAALAQVARPALTFASPFDVYMLYGKVVLLVFAALIIGVRGLNTAQRAVLAGGASKLQAWGYRLALAGLILNLFGNVGDFWVGEGTAFENVAFVGGTMVGLLLLVAGSIMLGISGLRTVSLPRPAAWALILWFPFALVLLAIGLADLPSSPLLALSLAWVVAAISLLRRPVEGKAP